ncbi:MAG: DUF1854 domain-containing protein [Burkholderiaceae bacterium]|jgi:hypothetical protein|nr:DUF1854 domain-containing protein [Burkholderiaceae bacterium]
MTEPISAPAASAVPTAPAADLQKILHLDALERLVYTDAQGSASPVTPVRAFALSAPDEGISLVGADGHELLWIARLSDVPRAPRALIERALAVRDFAPVLLRLNRISGYGMPSTWAVSTDRGDTRFVLRAEEDIRRLGDGALRITGADGLQLHIPDLRALDRASRRMLERFL